METRTEKVVLIGNQSVGKTSFVKRFVDNTFDENQTPTVGLDVESAVLDHNEQRIRIDLWTGSPDLPTQPFYKDAAAVIIMYDISRHISFQDAANKWLSEAKEAELKHPVLMLVGHKYDKRPLRSVETDEGQAIADQHDMIFLEASAVDNVNVVESFKNIIDAIDKKRMFYSETSTYGVQQEAPITFNIEDNNGNAEAKKGDCCSCLLS